MHTHSDHDESFDLIDFEQLDQQASTNGSKSSSNFFNHKNPREVFSAQVDSKVSTSQLTKRKQVTFDLNLNTVRTITKQLNIKKKVWRICEILDRAQFVSSPVPEHMILQCDIAVENSGRNYFYPKYTLRLSSNGLRILTAQKVTYGLRSTYLFGTEDQVHEADEVHLVGRMRSNATGSLYELHDTGKEEAVNPNELRCELGLINYNCQFLQTRATQNMCVVVPALQSGKPLPFKSTKFKDSLGYTSQSHALRGVKFLEFKNELPVWNNQQKVYVQSFDERVNTPSQHNFILKNQIGGEKIIQFGAYYRGKKQTLHLDIQHPFTPLQAFAVILSKLDKKIIE